MFHQLCKLLRRCLDRRRATVPRNSQPAEREMPSFFLDSYAPYRPLLDAGQFRYCIEHALRLLNGLKELAPAEYQTAHKGTPFYIMGYAAFASHDYSTASLFFDAAVAEDLRNHPGEPQAAVLFMELSDILPDGTPVLGTEIVRQIKADIDILIGDYNARPGARQVTLDELRTFFLRPIVTAGQPHTRTLVTALISFIAEWRYRATLINLFEHGSREPFFLHLLRGCVLFESLLKGQTKKVLTHNTLGDILRLDLLAELGIANVQVGANDFNAIVAGLIPNMDIEATINSTARARNTLGHNLVWMVTDLNAGTYDLLMKNISCACLHAISKLYRP
jgi:hypothetical protein